MKPTQPDNPPAEGGKAAWRRVTRGLTQHWVAWVAAALAFGLAYGQSPLYTSNQNQYFLHGAAQAGIGYLARDWLANTPDPTPIFTLLVYLTYRFLHPFAFYLYFLALAGVYLYSLVVIASSLFDLKGSRTRAVTFAGLLVFLHSAALRYVLSRGLGPQWEYLFDGGVAGQRLLGTVLQPSVFGILLLLAIALLLRGHPYLAAVCAALSADVHPTYLLSAAALTLGIMLVLGLETRRIGPPLRVGLFALALVAPIMAYVLLALGPGSSSLSQRAQDILVHVRLPQHAVPSEWFDATVPIKVALVALGLFAARRTRLFVILAVMTAVATLASLVQVVTKSDALALVFPWRLSTVLVPVSVALLVAWLVTRGSRGLEARLPSAGRIVTGIGAGGILALAAAGVASFKIETDRLQADPAQPMLAYVRHVAAPGEVYLIPPGLQSFRLGTGAPAFVDFKSIPYRAVDVVAWSDRMQLETWVYRDRPEYVDCSLLPRLQREYGVTDVVLDQDLLGLSCPSLRERYRDSSYAVFWITEDGG
jgi:hypothetical protein